MYMSTAQKPYRFENSSDNSVTVYLHGYIGSYDSINAATFMQEFDAATQGVENVTFNINSGGGSVIEGFSIVDLVKQRSKKITTEVYGMAGSMGFVLMLLGEKIRISKNSSILTHRVSAYAMGDADALRITADQCQQYEERIVEMTMRRTGKDKTYVSEWFKSGKDKWFNANQALAEKLVDEIIQEGEDAPAIPTNASPKEVFNNFYNVSNPNPNMKMFYAKLGTPEGDEHKAVDRINALLAAEAKVAVLEAQLRQAQDEKAKALVNAAVTAGKIKADAAALYEELAMRDYPTCEKIINSLEVPVVATPVVPVTTQGVSLKDAINNAASGKNTHDERTNWTYIDWAKKDPKGLENMTNEQRETLKNKK